MTTVPCCCTVRAWVQEGTYYAELDAVGEDPSGPQDSQGYLPHVATRAIIVIDADDAAIGLVAALFVGMVEVSSCVIHDTIVPGRQVRKGEELGYFQYGGSTYCLIFRPNVIAAASLAVIPGPGHPESLPVLLHAHLFTARQVIRAGPPSAAAHHGDGREPKRRISSR